MCQNMNYKGFLKIFHFVNQNILKLEKLKKRNIKNPILKK